ncbi:hypothetical protein FRB90_010462 [Tulasnella sp. 427]|nr:hypothetical protein FRB90_010462 [Tulasnella sp. 427]
MNPTMTRILAIYPTGDQDELTRLRKRVLELEHTVRVLTQRHSPREAFDEKVLLPGSSRPQGSADDDSKAKKSREHASSSINVPGYPRVTTHLASSGHGSPSSGSTTLGSLGHCGCAGSVVGRQILGQLQTNLADSIARLKDLPEHQRHNVNCPLYAQVVHLHHHIGSACRIPAFSEGMVANALLQTHRQSIGNNAMQRHVAYPGGAAQSSYGHQSPYAPTASSHSSASPPQTIASDFITFNPNDPTFDLTAPAEPFPYNAPHSSTLAHTLSQSIPSSLSHPQLSSGTTSHNQNTLSYTLSNVSGLVSPGATYHSQQYQQPSQPVQSYAAAMPAMPRAGPSSSVQASSLSTWNSMGGSTTAQASHRHTSKSTRSPSTRPAK